MYTKSFWNHFIYRHVIYDYNKLHHSQTSIEEKCITQLWPNRVFAYLLATSEVNTFLAYRYFFWNEYEIPEYEILRRNLREQLIKNSFLLSERAHLKRQKKWSTS